MNRYLKFLKAYIKSMRPYTFLITGSAGILGMLLVGANFRNWKSVVILLLLFTSYGLNQVINDLLGQEEDKYNAPERPLVSGELKKKSAISFTFLLVLIGAVATYFLNPQALIVYFLAYLMNFIYERLKGFPFGGNLWFGIMISLAPLYGALVVSGESLLNIISNLNLIYLILIVISSASSLCYFTFFKDYKGDKKANKRTLIVALGPEKASYYGIPIALLPFGMVWAGFQFNILTFGFNYIFLILILTALALCLYMLYYLINNLEKQKRILEFNFECTALFLNSLVALLRPMMGLFLFILSFFLIKFTYFLMYKNEFY